MISNLSLEIDTLGPIHSMQFFPDFALAVLTTVEMKFPFFQQAFVEKSTQEFEQV